MGTNAGPQFVRTEFRSRLQNRARKLVQKVAARRRPPTVAGRPAALRFRSTFRTPKWGPPNSTKPRQKKAVDKHKAVAGAIREYVRLKENHAGSTNLVLACPGWAVRSFAIWASWRPRSLAELTFHTSPIAQAHFRRAHCRKLRLSPSAAWMFVILDDSWGQRGPVVGWAHQHTHAQQSCHQGASHKTGAKGSPDMRGHCHAHALAAGRRRLEQFPRRL